MHSLPLASVVGVLLALGGTTGLAFFKHREKTGPINKTRHLTLTWGTCLALLALVFFWEQRPWSSIGVIWGNYGAWAWGCALGVAVLLVSGASIQMASKKPGATMPKVTEQGLLRLTGTPAWFRVVIVLTAGITEEIMFRGYPIERLHDMTGNLWLAALIPLAVFVLAHLSAWSGSHLISVFIGGGVLTGLYLWQHDLIACMIAHALIDAPIIILPLMMKKFGEKPARAGMSVSGDPA